MKVLVSNPVKQYTHQLCVALLKNKSLHGFFTTIWYKPKHPTLNKLSRILPKKISKSLVGTLKKRYFEMLPVEFVNTHSKWEIIRQLLKNIFKRNGEKWVFYVERKHDKWVASQIKTLQLDAVIGYEKSCLDTFKTAKKKGIITILDLAQVHYGYIEYLRETYHILSPDNATKSLNKRINIVKKEEYQLADYIIVISSFAKQTLIDGGVPASKIIKINLGFDPKNFIPKKKYRANNDVFKILFVGSIMKRKGIHLLLQAYKELNLKNAELILTGPMADAHSLLKEYKGSYTYQAFLPHEELVNTYQDADIFVFPSFLDSWAMVVLEAMACGTPVIISENTGAKDAVSQGGGYIIPVDDKEALKEQILKLYNNRELVENLGIEAAKIAQQYTWDNYYENVKKITNRFSKN